jgi:hypothetical protein
MSDPQRYRHVQRLLIERQQLIELGGSPKWPEPRRDHRPALRDAGDPSTAALMARGPATDNYGRKRSDHTYNSALGHDGLQAPQTHRSLNGSTDEARALVHEGFTPASIRDMRDLGARGYSPGEGTSPLLDDDWKYLDRDEARRQILAEIGITEKQYEYMNGHANLPAEHKWIREKFDDALLDITEAGGSGATLARGLGWYIDPTGRQSRRLKRSLERARARRAAVAA